MSTPRFSQRLATFALAAVMTLSVLAALSSLADSTLADAQQLASTVSGATASRRG